MPLAVSLALLLQVASPPPPVVSHPHLPVGTPLLLRWMPGAVVCGSEAVAGAVMEPPNPGIATTKTTPAQRFRFRVEASGRPVGITRAMTGWVTAGEDLAPSLAASRLPPGAREACAVTYTPETFALAEAPLADLVSYTLTPQTGPLAEEGWKRIRPAGGDCDRAPRAEWRVQATPEWRDVPAAPGTRAWSLVGHDLDAHGRPRRAAIAAGTGNAALDRAALAALAASRLSDGPRQGCLNPYLRPSTRLAAPADVDPETLRPAGATCPPTHDWARQPTPTYPEPWRRRAIEGWAVVAYDVAPWGEIGNVRALAAEPAAELGEHAVRIVRGAAWPTGGQGATGCVERVRFAMGPGTIEAP